MGSFVLCTSTSLAPIQARYVSSIHPNSMQYFVFSPFKCLQALYHKSGILIFCICIGLNLGQIPRTCLKQNINQVEMFAVVSINEVSGAERSINFKINAGLS